MAPDYFGATIHRNRVYYRVIRINCPVDIEVYDEYGALIGTIRDEVPEELANAGITVAVDNDGQKTLYLPADDKYTIRIIATDSGEMSLQINEYSRDAAGFVRTLNYYDIPLETGDTFEAEVYQTDPDGFETAYVMMRTNRKNAGEVIRPDEDLRADEVQSFNVTLHVEGSGTVSGSGDRVQESFAMLAAEPAEGHTFSGWYSEGQRVSTEAEYRFRVHEDVELTARFSSGGGGSRPSSGGGSGGSGPGLGIDSELLIYLSAGLAALLILTGLLLMVRRSRKNKMLPANAASQADGSYAPSQGRQTAAPAAESVWQTQTPATAQGRSTPTPATEQEHQTPAPATAQGHQTQNPAHASTSQAAPDTPATKTASGTPYGLCPKCGVPLLERARNFCHDCGAIIRGIVEE